MKTKICYLLLCHKAPEAVIKQVNYLTATDAYVVLHMDKRAPQSAHDQLREKFQDNSSVRFTKPVKAGWGDWSLVNATLRMIDIGLREFRDATNFYLLSGDCVPIRSHEDLEKTFSSQKVDYIETTDFYRDNWIKTGPHLERVKYFHFINERKRQKAFYASYKVQEWLNIERNVPVGIQLSIGSQWWCLRRRTLERIKVFLRARPEVIRFFKTCWIPDEIFFQSVVATLVPESERVSIPPTFFRFSDYGLPAVFYNDHYEFLTSQEEFFARKISPGATWLKERLIKQFVAGAKPRKTVNTGRETIGFNAYAGRQGVRFGPTVWQRGGRMPADSRLYVIVSKKWDKGFDLGEKISAALKIPNLGYIFDLDDMEIGEMGGFEKDREKRLQAPVPFLRMLYEVFMYEEAIVGVDPSRYDLIKALSKSSHDARLIILENEFSPYYLQGHAERSGVGLEQSNLLDPTAIFQTFTEIFRQEYNRIKTIEFSQSVDINEWQPTETQAEIIASIFDETPQNMKELMVPPKPAPKNVKAKQK